MKPITFNRRRLLGGLLFLVPFLSRCKKEDLTKTTTTPPKDLDLSAYGATENGDQLYQPDDITKILHGYTDKISYNPGDTVSLYLSGPANSAQPITLKDAIGNAVLSFTTSVKQQTIGNKPWLNGFQYEKTTSIKLPDNLKSGFYRFPGDIPIICKGKADSSPAITIVFPSNTFHAYCYYGGKSLYRPDDDEVYRAYVVSFLRYNPAPSGNFNDSYFRWMAQQTYDTKYIADIDLDDYSEIENSKLLIIAGHSEYWTREARLNVDKFIASGKNVLILSGNTMYYQVRYNLEKNLMICYKDNSVDPLKNTIYSTIFWYNPSLKYPVITSIGADFQGGSYPERADNPMNGFKIVNEESPLFDGTGLKNGDILYLPTQETDGAPVKKMILPGSLEIPEIDNSKLNFYKVELLAYTFAPTNDHTPGLGTFIVFQKNPTSGTVVNVASTNWCSPAGIGGTNKLKIQTITKNMIDRSLSGNTLLSK
jgi:hypothetical protein